MTIQNESVISRDQEEDLDFEIELSEVRWLLVLVVVLLVLLLLLLLVLLLLVVVVLLLLLLVVVVVLLVLVVVLLVQLLVQLLLELLPLPLTPNGSAVRGDGGPAPARDRGAARRGAAYMLHKDPCCAFLKLSLLLILSHL